FCAAASVARHVSNRADTSIQPTAAGQDRNPNQAAPAEFPQSAKNFFAETPPAGCAYFPPGAVRSPRCSAPISQARDRKSGKCHPAARAQNWNTARIGPCQTATASRARRESQLKSEVKIAVEDNPEISPSASCPESRCGRASRSKPVVHTHSAAYL